MYNEKLLQALSINAAINRLKKDMDTFSEIKEQIL